MVFHQLIEVADTKAMLDAVMFLTGGTANPDIVKRNILDVKLASVRQSIAQNKTQVLPLSHQTNPTDKR